MRNRIILAAALAALAGPVRAQELKVEEHVLPNGMKLLLVPRADEPTIAAGWVAHVGSANERPGITGISHLFEHMMFKGTQAIGTKDAARDEALIGEQERVRGLMRDEDAKLRAALRRGEIDDITKPETKTARYKELDKEFDALVKEQRDLLVKNEFDRIYTKGGASGMNASTNTDLTQYFVAVPKNRLELWFWMESDRLLHPSSASSTPSATSSSRSGACGPSRPRRAASTRPSRRCSGTATPTRGPSSGTPRTSPRSRRRRRTSTTRSSTRRTTSRRSSSATSTRRRRSRSPGRTSAASPAGRTRPRR